MDASFPDFMNSLFAIESRICNLYYHSDFYFQIFILSCFAVFSHTMRTNPFSTLLILLLSSSPAFGATFRRTHHSGLIPTMQLLSSTDALIVVDVQNDFLPDGSLATPLGNSILDPIYDFMRNAHSNDILISASRDFHPENHISFAHMGGQWPVHCIQNSKGADFAPGFPSELLSIEVKKGTDIKKEAYSAFQDTSLDTYLRGAGIMRVFIVGIATEFCVWNTAKDAKELGYETVVIEDLITEVLPENKREQLDIFRAAGLVVVHSSNLRFASE